MKEKRGLLALTELLMNNDIHQETIEKSLEIICDYFSFQGGAVYETDDINHFYKKESYESSLILPHHVPFDISKIPIALNQKIFHLDQDTYQPISQMNILDIFQVPYGLFVPLTYNETHGFLVFTGEKDKMQLSEQEEKELFIFTGLLARYIITRISEKKTKLIHKTYESIIDNTGIDIYVNDFYTHDILYVNESMAAPYGGKAFFEKKKCWEVLFPGQTGPCEFCPQVHIVDEQQRPSSVYTWDYQRAFDGSWFRVFSAAFYWIDGRLAHVVSSADISDNKEKEALIEYMANYDELTDLPNQRKLLNDGQYYIHHIQANENMYVLFFDIDGFKNINDSYGHKAGDEFLVGLSHFFKSIPMLKDVIYRNGGDEFVAIICGQNISKMNIDNLARFIHNRFDKAWKLKKGDVYCDVSIGVAIYQEDADNIEDLLHIADLAMYQAKKSGAGHICYGADIKI